jgi:hypothetical protein
MKKTVIVIMCIYGSMSAIERFEDAESKRIAIAGFTLPGAYKGTIDTTSPRDKLLHELKMNSPRAARRRRGLYGKDLGHQAKKNCDKRCGRLVCMA